MGRGGFHTFPLQSWAAPGWTQSQTWTDPSVAAERRVRGRSGCQAWAVVRTGAERSDGRTECPRCWNRARCSLASGPHVDTLKTCTPPSNPVGGDVSPQAHTHLYYASPHSPHSLTLTTGPADEECPLSPPVQYYNKVIISVSSIGDVKPRS